MKRTGPPPPPRGPPHNANMSGHTPPERAEGTTPLTTAPALTVVGRQFDRLGSTDSPFGNNNSRFVTHHGDHQRGDTPPPAPPQVPCTSFAAPTLNTSIRQWLPITRDLNPLTSVGSGPRPPTPPGRSTHSAFSAVPTEPLSAPGPFPRDTSTPASPTAPTAHRMGLPCAGATRHRGTPPSQSHSAIASDEHNPRDTHPGQTPPRQGIPLPLDVGYGPWPPTPLPTTIPQVPHGSTLASSRTARASHSDPAVLAGMQVERPGHPRPPPQRLRGTLPRLSTTHDPPAPR